MPKSRNSQETRISNLIRQYRQEQAKMQQAGRYHDAEFYDVLVEGALEDLAEYRRNK